ncbi:hypothetical protein D3C85_1917470 [compost metagenome]
MVKAPSGFVAIVLPVFLFNIDTLGKVLPVVSLTTPVILIKASLFDAGSVFLTFIITAFSPI